MVFTNTKAFADWQATAKAGEAAGQTFHDADEDIEIPPYLRKPDLGSREGAQWIISSIDHRVERLAAKGLNPHPQLLENRQHCTDFLDGSLPELDNERFIVRRTF